VANGLTGSGTKQGDHVFNDLQTAIERPIHSIRSATNAGVDGHHFLIDYLPHGADLARRILRDPIWLAVRQYVAAPGQEQDGLNRLNRVATNRGFVARVTYQKLVHAHLENAERFGQAANRFEFEFLSAMVHALTVAIKRPDSSNNSNLIFNERASPIIAFQSMVNAAFDPAAAMIVLIDRADKENALGQGSILNLIEAIWGTIDPNRPALWADAWNQFRETRPQPVVKLVNDVRSALNGFSALKVAGQSEILQTLSEAASGRKSGVKPDEWTAHYAYMIAASTTRVEQLRNSVRA
jgi:hypothetical protein